MATRSLSARTRVAAPVLGRADLQFQIEQLRMDKVIFGIEALVVSFLAVLTAVFLPELLYRVMLGAGQTETDLSLLSWIPTVSYAVAVLSTLYVLVSNNMRWAKIKRLERQLSMA